ncbi:MAG: hypothetical protein ABI550_03965 [Ignavibacteriaceae bacterium]
MVLEEKKELSKFIIIAFAAVVSIKIWSFDMVSEGKLNIFEVPILLLLIAISIYGYNDIYRNTLIFKYNVHFFIFIPLLSAYGALLYHHQSIGHSLVALRSNFYWLLYFVLHIFNIPKKKIVNLMIFIGAVWIFLTIIQQFTYPRYYFFSRDDNDQSIYRAGVYRYMITGHQYADFVLFYFFYKFLITKKINNLVFTLLALVGFYFYGTRQFALSALICMCISVFFVSGMIRIYIFILLCIATAVIFQFKDQLFGQYVELTADQLKYGDDIRLLSGNFFLTEYWPSKIARLIGNGADYAFSRYGKEMQNINLYLHFYRSDVGIIGAFSQFGLFYVINIFWLNIKGLTGNYFMPENNYLRLFFLNALLLIVLSTYYSNPTVIPFYCFILYLVDKSFEEKKLAAQETNAQFTPGTLETST